MTTFDRIKKLSMQHNKNVKEVAKELNFGENLFYKWKTQSPTTDNLQKVADYFGVSTDYLLGRTDDPTGYFYSEKTLDAVDMIIDSDNDEFMELIDNLPLLDRNELKVVNDMVKSLVALKQKKS